MQAYNNDVECTCALKDILWLMKKIISVILATESVPTNYIL